MRDNFICPKCHHNHVLLIAAVADSMEVGMNPGYLNVAVVPLAKKKFLSDQNLDRAGHVEAVVCRRCGYTELFTREPQAIPVDGKYVRECVGSDPTAQ